MKKKQELRKGRFKIDSFGLFDGYMYKFTQELLDVFESSPLIVLSLGR